MRKIVVKILYKLLRIIDKKDNNSNTNKANIKLGQNSVFTGKIDASRSKNGKIVIGEDCLIQGDFYLETDEAIIEIGDHVFIGPGTRIVSTKCIVIESYVLISADCIIQDSDNHSLYFEVRKNDLADWKNNYHNWTLHPSKEIKISFGAWIGIRTIILKGVTIGERSVIGAGSVVTKDVPNDCVAAGNPAKVVKKIDQT